MVYFEGTTQTLAKVRRLNSTSTNVLARSGTRDSWMPCSPQLVKIQGSTPFTRLEPEEQQSCSSQGPPLQWFRIMVVGPLFVGSLPMLQHGIRDRYVPVYGWQLEMGVVGPSDVLGRSSRNPLTLHDALLEYLGRSEGPLGRN